MKKYILDTPKKVLLAMAQVFTYYPYRWTRYDFAKAETGGPVSPKDPYAFRFCASGLLQRMTHERLCSAYTADDVSRIFLNANYNTMMTINDSKGRVEVIDALKKAAAIC